MIEDGMLKCTGEKGPWLRSTEQFADFNVRLEYKLKTGGNSGVYIRVPEDGDHHGDGSGIEVQIIDDTVPNLKPYQFTGSLYAIVPAVYPTELRNTGAGLAIGIGRCGAILSPYLAGVLLAAGWKPSSAYLAFGAPLLVAAAATVVLGRLQAEVSGARGFAREDRK